MLEQTTWGQAETESHLSRFLLPEDTLVRQRQWSSCISALGTTSGTSCKGRVAHLHLPSADSDKCYLHTFVCPDKNGFPDADSCCGPAFRNFPMWRPIDFE